ncbi:hypothetical protein B7R25_17175 [Subtercola boreus]|uniref:Uncharacterized protein n=2 Tax=Subtercola boreus TaxID=120213 RepID=A0A3E0W5E1_9MICO|nr:hypothetical protein B7R24_16860 [Subtercola boreus]RFA17647.1 hypothetical protein B7R23_17020 [Subtercola boreus]RFA24228.1 hypothetical protein B7R25_17175 [Subtercola boreus]
MGIGAPLQQTVKNVCAACNNGWMSGLENHAKRVLTSLLLGESDEIRADDQGPVAMWLQKTAFMAMLLSSAEDREAGYGVPPSEYRLLYEQRNTFEPLGTSRFWVGRYVGELGHGSVWVTPLSVGVAGHPESDLPDGYSMTIVLGALLLHGVRFTHLPFPVDLATRHLLGDLWPAALDAGASVAGEITEDQFFALARGRAFVVSDENVTLRPWRPATELEESSLIGSMIEMPTLCGKHVAYYPADLFFEAQQGRFYWFMTGCECGIGYLIHTEHDGAHTKAAETPEQIGA